MSCVLKRYLFSCSMLYHRFEITVTITLIVEIYLKVGIFLDVGFTKIEFTVYEKTWDWEFILYGPEKFGPDPQKVKELGICQLIDGDLVFDWNSDTNNVICETKGGSVGEEGTFTLCLRSVFELFQI